MKRLLLILSVLLYAVFATANTAWASADANQTYARAKVRDAYFFTERDLTTSIFTVPYTYCVEVLRDEGEWYYASYATNNGIYKELKGYCRKQDFEPVEGRPEVTYLYKTVSVTYKSGDGASSLPVLNEITVEAAFYGNFYSGATAYSYVYAQGSFGYIKGSIDDYPLNIADKEPQTPDGESGGESGKINFGLIAALVICALAALALIMLYYTSKKKTDADG